MQTFKPLPVWAKQIGLAPITLRRAVMAGHIKASKIGNKWIIGEEDIQNWLISRSSQRPTRQPETT